MLPVDTKRVYATGLSNGSMMAYRLAAEAWDAFAAREGFDRPIYLHGAMERLTEFYKSEGVALGETPKVVATERSKLAGAVVSTPRRCRISLRRAMEVPGTAPAVKVP